jgi:alkylation response protein AidB-like acyl-CoA dehydrogenase
MMKGPYKEAYKLGFAMGFLPKEYGGGGISNVDLQIVAEETTAVDPGFATILLVKRARPDAGRLVRQRRAEAQMDRCRDQRQEP